MREGEEQFINTAEISIKEPDLTVDIEEYDQLLGELSNKIDGGASLDEIKELDKQRKKLKSVIAQKIMDGFENEDNPENQNFIFLKSLAENILGESLANGEKLEDAILRAFAYVQEVLTAVAYSDNRSQLKQTDPDKFEHLKNEYSRLKDMIRKYLEPQNLVSEKNKREPSIMEAIAASAKLNKIKEEVVENVREQADAVVVAGSLNWGMFYDTRGLGTSRSLIDSEWKEGDLRKQYSVKKIEDEGMVIREEIVNELSDVDVVIIAKENENINDIYESIFKNSDDPEKEKNLKIIERFKRLIDDSNINEFDKPVSINLDFVDKEGFRAQLIIFSNSGFKRLYDFDINRLEELKANEDENHPPHVKTKVEVSDLENGGPETTSEATLFLHGNLDYKEGKKEWVEAKAKKSGEFQQALIGGKRIVGSYPSVPLGDPILVDEENKIYGQYYIKYYPFGGFMEDKNDQCNSYFLGFNTDNMISGQNYGREDTFAGRIAKEYKYRYFKRIAMEQKLKNNISLSEVLNMSPDVIFGPYLSRWARIPEHYKQELFAEFRSFLEKEYDHD